MLACDACREPMHEESFSFDINFMVRKRGGGGVLQDGVTNVEWDLENVYGELCGECSKEVIERLNETLWNK